MMISAVLSDALGEIDPKFSDVADDRRRRMKDARAAPAREANG